MRAQQWGAVLLLLLQSYLSPSFFVHSLEGSDNVKMELVEEGLPEIRELLAEVELSHLTEKFYESGFTETKYILRMKDMDLRIMAMEWGVDKDAILRVKEAIQNYKKERPIDVQTEDPLLVERNRLKYGRLVVNGSTASFEYFTAYFSAPMEREFQNIVGAPDGDACSLDKMPAENQAQIAGKMIVAPRGGCSFLEKSRNVSAVNGSALIVVNNDTSLFHIAAGYATGVDFVEETDVPTHLPVVMVKQQALSPLFNGSKHRGSLVGRLVPLKCRSGEIVCSPILEEEKEIIQEIDSGLIEVSSTLDQYEFLSGNWGGILPHGEVDGFFVDDMSGCSPYEQAERTNAFAIVHRGACSFGDKVRHAQEAGMKGVVVISFPEDALQRMGVTSRQAANLSIPALAVSSEAGEALHQEFQRTGRVKFVISELPGMAERWLELSLTEWPVAENDFNVVYRQLKQKNSDSQERLAWIDRARKAHRNRSQEPKSEL